MSQAWNHWVLEGCLVALVGASFMGGCFNPAPVANQADAPPLRDARIPDSRLDAPIDAPIDAPPGSNPALARPPKTCNTEVSGEVINASFPGWTATTYTGGAVTDQRFYKCAATNVFALSSSYIAPRNPAGMAPSINYTRNAMFFGAEFEFAYTVESIDQPGESGIAFAGGFALSLDPGVEYSVTSLGRRLSDGMVLLRTIDQDDTLIASKNIGVLTPPYRVRWRGTRMGAALRSTITIYTATSTTDYIAAVVPLPDPALQLLFGINRFEVGATTRMVFSDMVLP